MSSGPCLCGDPECARCFPACDDPFPPEVLAEYDMCAEWCAARGIAGRDGDPLPPLSSAAVVSAIAYDPEAFQARVKAFAYARAMASLNLPEE